MFKSGKLLQQPLRVLHFNSNTSSQMTAVSSSSKLFNDHHRQVCNYATFIRPALLQEETDEINAQQAREIIANIKRQSVLMNNNNNNNRNNSTTSVKSKGKSASFIPSRIRHRIRSSSTSSSTSSFPNASLGL